MNIIITINQYPAGYVFSSDSLLRSSSSSKSLGNLSSVSSATPRYNYLGNDKFDEDDFKKEKVSYLYHSKGSMYF